MPQELLEKSVAIARSGIQTYLRRELPALKVGPIPEQHKDKKTFSVYRSAPLIADSKDLFTKKPFIYTHKAYVNPNNFSDLVQGWVGDTATLEMNEAKTEVTIRADLTIGGAEAIQAYKDRGEREVSPMYFGKFEWKDGVSPDGMPYEIEMIEVSGVNHLALVPAGRGGDDASILDHLEEEPKFLSAIWRTVKRFLGVKDELPETFRVRLTEIAKARDTYTEDSIRDAAKILYDCITDIPFTNELGVLQRMLADIVGLIGKNEDEAMKYVEIVSDLYEKLDSESLSEITEKEQSMAGKSADEMAEEEKAKKEAAAKDAAMKDADREYEELDKKIKDHRAAGGKASDWKIGSSKDEDEQAAKEKADKEREEEVKAKEKKEAEAKDEEEAKKKEEEEKKEAEAKDAAAVYDSAPWSQRFGSSHIGSDPAADLLGKMGYGPGKEKK